MDDRIIRLDQFLKLVGWADSGGVAKHLIQDGLVQVNGEVDTRRSRKLHVGDTVAFQDESATVSADMLRPD